METSTQIKPSLKSTLMSMEIGDILPFPIEKRGSVRTTISYMKELSDIVFKTKKLDNEIVVERKS